MKKLVQPVVMALFALSLTACRHSAKEGEMLTATNTTTSTASKDEITKNVFTDSYGDQMEVAVNHTNNTITIHLDGKTYELKKNDDLPDYTASNAEYQYSDINGNITFLKKNIDMVLFHLKSDKNRSSNKMASY
ncbi:hypothetical protein SAMN05421664_0747 [Chryseobacterium soldanellicola]|uniref:Multicopper oxidase n=1 Tax=Chryseobacterium soldanellicola TaxID=311333 RepID=A0A1H0YI82_9FLAO|nr:hypothetical protein [Chryseobacterium soldanellicola]SDQ14965.1 hypothetical protein SAMN05421664_0747 [Chryseobacterium soldanellicola]